MCGGIYLVQRGALGLLMVLVGYGGNGNRKRALEKVERMVCVSDHKHFCK